MIDSVNQLMRETVDKLDKNMWSQYVDFTKLESYQLAKDSTEEIFNNFYLSSSILVYCLLCQNTLQKTKNGQLPR